MSEKEPAEGAAKKDGPPEYIVGSLEGEEAERAMDAVFEYYLGPVRGANPPKDLDPKP